MGARQKSRNTAGRQTLSATISPLNDLTCIWEASSGWGQVFAAWWARSDLLLHQILSPDLCSLHFLSSDKHVALPTCFIQADYTPFSCKEFLKSPEVSQWHFPFKPQLWVPHLYKAIENRTPGPLLVSMPTYSWQKVCESRGFTCICCADGCCICSTEWADASSFPICTLGSHHGAAGNYLRDWEFNRTHASIFYTRYCKISNRKSSNTHTYWCNMRMQSSPSLKCHLNAIAGTNTTSSHLLKGKGPM